MLFGICVYGATDDLRANLYSEGLLDESGARDKLVLAQPPWTIGLEPPQGAVLGTHRNKSTTIVDSNQAMWTAGSAIVLLANDRCTVRLAGAHPSAFVARYIIFFIMLDRVKRDLISKVLITSCDVPTYFPPD